MAVNSYQWSVDLLKKLGNPNPTDNTIAFVGGWSRAEFGYSGPGQCTYNFLATTQPYGSAGNCNAAGVKSYGSYQDSLNATAQVLNNGRYPSLLHALKTNDENGLGFHNHSIAANVQGDLSVWSSGARLPVNASYINNIWQLSSGKSDATTDTSPISTQSQAANATPGLPGGCAPWDFGCMLGQIHDQLVSFAEHIAIFALALLLVVIGLSLLAAHQARDIAQKVML